MTPDEIRDQCACPSCGKDGLHSEVAEVFYNHDGKPFKCPHCGALSDIRDGYQWNGEDSVFYFTLLPPVEDKE